MAPVPVTSIIGVFFAFLTGRGQWKAAASLARGTVSFGPVGALASADPAHAIATSAAQAANDVKRWRERMARGTLTG